MSEAARARPVVVRVGWVLAVAALFGALAGVALERTQASELEAEVDRLRDAPADLAAMPHAPPPPPPVTPQKAVEGLPPYPGAKVESLGEDLVLSGMPAAIAWFTTRDPPEDVLRFYEKELVEQGFPALSHRFSAYAGYAGWLDYFSGQMHLVTAVVQGDETLVFVSNASPEEFDQAKAGLPEAFPTPRGAGEVSVMRMGLEGREQLLVTTRLEAGMGGALEAVQAGLSSNGWQATRPEYLDMRQVRLVARRHHAMATIVLRIPPEAGRVDVFITYNGS